MVTRRQLLLDAGLAAATSWLAACSPSGVGHGGAELRGSKAVLELPFDSTPGVDIAARAGAALGWSILAAEPGANKVIAPSSLAITLGMLAEGATGGALDSLNRAFGLPDDRRSAALGALRQSLLSYESLPNSLDVNDPPKSPVVHQASQAVVVDGKPVERAFLDRIGQYFDAAIWQAPHLGLKQALDDWVRQNTAGLIRQSAIQVDPSLVFVLQDALLFAAAWRTEFAHDDVPLAFNGAGGQQDVKALSGRFHVPYAEGDGWAAARLPYDDNLAMDVILPAAGTAPGDLPAERLDAVLAALDAADQRDVELTMPPCNLSGELKLLPALHAQGITFDDGLDGIFPGAVVQQFIQQVRLQVGAKGTVGAAVTEVGVGAGAPGEGPVELRVDRPYAMRVQDVRTGWPLFLAIVADARAAAG